MHLDGVDQIDLSIVNNKMCFGKKKQNKQQQENIGVTRLLTIGDCELRSLLNMWCNHGSPEGIICVLGDISELDAVLSWIMPIQPLVHKFAPPPPSYACP